MRQIVCLAGCQHQRSAAAAAAELFTDPLFRLSYRYARSLKPHRIFILSAAHGLLAPDETAAPSPQGLERMSAAERRDWAARVIDRLAGETHLDSDAFLFLAGARYREHLTPALRRWSAPMEGLSRGEQLRWLKQRVGD